MCCELYPATVLLDLFLLFFRYTSRLWSTRPCFCAHCRPRACCNMVSRWGLVRISCKKYMLILTYRLPSSWQIAWLYGSISSWQSILANNPRLLILFELISSPTWLWSSSVIPSAVGWISQHVFQLNFQQTVVPFVRFQPRVGQITGSFAFGSSFSPGGF